MKKYIYKILSLFLFISLSNCNDFLDEIPSKTVGVPITKVEQLEAILNDFGIFGTQQLDDVVFGTDDYELNTNLFNNDLQNSIDIVLNAVLDTEFIQKISSSDRYWNSPWKKIYRANLILHFADLVEGDAIKKEQLKMEARFIRAYTYLKLVSVYSLPYSEQNKSELGLPIKKEINFEESLVRASLEETYNFIEEDLKEALKLNKDIVKIGTDNLNQIWRANTAAINGFAARFYLTKNDYAKAQKYAEIALGANSSLVDYNTGIAYVTETETIYTPTRERVIVSLPSTYENSDLSSIVGWNGLYYYRLLSSERGGYWPSRSLLNTYDKVNDLRYQYHIVEGFSYLEGARGNRFGDLAFNYPGYVFFGSGTIVSGPSTPEMLLIKAESQIRQEKWQQGIATANILRAKRIDNTAPANVINLTATNKQDALTKVLEERRRELAFVSRWDDIRRYNNNDDSSDDVTINRTFYPYSSGGVDDTKIAINYTILPKSRKYARPIPNGEILSSDNQLVQNKY